MGRHQDILNAVPEPFPQRQTEVPVTAHIVWSEDGDDFIDTLALGWSGRRVKIRLFDERSATRLVWLMAEDVERR